MAVVGVCLAAYLGLAAYLAQSGGREWLPFRLGPPQPSQIAGGGAEAGAPPAAMSDRPGAQRAQSNSARGQAAADRSGPATGPERGADRNAGGSPWRAGTERGAADEEEPEDAPPPLAIAGSVLDDQGEPLPGVQVSAQRVGSPGVTVSRTGAAGMLTRTSDAAGMFVFEPVDEGEYDLSATVADGSLLPAHLRVRAGVSAAELRMHRVRAVRVYGRVSDTRGGPLERVEVRVLGEGRAVQSDARGEYSIMTDLVRAGQPPVLQFQRPPFRELRQRVPAALDPTAESVRLDVRMQPGDATVALWGLIAGTGGEPLAGVPLWVSSTVPRVYRRAVTDEAGEFRLEGLELGDAYRVGIDAAGEYDAYLSVPFPIGPDDTRHDVVLERVDYARLSGRLVDPEGAPLPGFSLWLRHLDSPGQPVLPVEAGPGGWFRLEQVAAGEHRLETRSQPRLEASGITLAPGEDREVLVPLDWGPHWLFGRVVDPSGAGLAQAQVTLQWSQQNGAVRSASQRRTSTDAAGYFAFANLGGGSHELRVELAGYELSRSVHDPRSVADEVRIQLQRRDALAGGAGG